MTKAADKKMDTSISSDILADPASRQAFSERKKKAIIKINTKEDSIPSQQQIIYLKAFLPKNC